MKTFRSFFLLIELEMNLRGRVHFISFSDLIFQQLMRALLKKIPQFKEMLKEGKTSSQMIKDERNFQQLCAFFNWFLHKVERRYKQSLNK